MRIFEIADAEAQLALWKLVNDSVCAFSRPNWTLSPRQTGQSVHAKLIS